MTLRQIRRASAWLLVVPFLVWSEPSFATLQIGLVLSLFGLGVRAWSAGVIDKDARLATTGPYALARHPLYLGSLLLGLGVTIAGGRWVWPPVFLAYFAVVYGATIRREERLLREHFPAAFDAYAERTPAIVPRPRLPPVRRAEPFPGEARRFAWARYLRNREWEAALGTLAAYSALAAKAVLS